MNDTVIATLLVDVSPSNGPETTASYTLSLPNGLKHEVEREIIRRDEPQETAHHAVGNFLREPFCKTKLRSEGITVVQVSYVDYGASINSDFSVEVTTNERGFAR